MALDHKAANVSRRLLLPGKHVIWLDNLFTTIPLLERLRKDGIGAAGTVRTSKTPREISEAAANKSTSQASSQALASLPICLPTPLASQQDPQLPERLKSLVDSFSDSLIKCKP